MSPGTNIVSVTGQLTGNLGSNGSEVAYPQANADYVVAAPTNVSIKASSVAGPQSIVSPPTVSLQLGNYPNLPAGIVFNFSATVPSGGSGSYAATQLIKTCTSSITNGVTNYASANTSSLALDTEVFYGGNIESTSSAYTNNDNPGSSLQYTSTTQRLSRTDSFETFMMYKPTGIGSGAGNSIWIPLGDLVWAWSGTTNQVNANNWTPATGASPNPTATYAVGTIPTWSTVFTKSSRGTTVNNC